MSHDSLRGFMGAIVLGVLFSAGCSSPAPKPTPTASPTPAPTSRSVTAPALQPTPVAATQPATGPAVPGAGRAQADANGVVRVTANFIGDSPPRRAVIKMDADARCVQANAGRKVGTDNVLINADGTIQNVIVYVSAGLEGKKFDTPAAKATINQVGCMYVPHVQTVMISQVVTIINSDPTMHNIHSLAKKSREFNFAQPNPGDRRDVSFARPEFVKIKCDVHPWMSAFVGVFDHPHHAVTDKKGVCVLELPPGAYELSAWHEELGEAKPQKVNIKAGEMLNLTFEFEQE